jgi:photosystem II stability/assembly factor-like uncharacterized protein
MNRAAGVGVLFLLCSMTMTMPAAAVGWDLEASPTVQNLYAVAASDADTWVAVGDGGVVVRSTDGGLDWTTVSSPVADALRGVSFNGPVGLAVAIGGRILRTTDSGASWTVQARPTHKNLYAVSMGPVMTVATGEEGGIFVSTDNGVSWNQRFAGTASILFGVSVQGSFAIGGGGQGAIVNTVDGGAGWGLQIMDPAELVFYAASLVNSSTGWLVGSFIPTGSVILRTDNSGFVWTSQPTPTPDILFGVSSPTVDVGTAVGANGSIIRTIDGQNWVVEAGPTAQSLNGVSLLDPDFGIAVGNGGTILRRTGGTAGVADGIGGAGRQSLEMDPASPNPTFGTTSIRFTLDRFEPVSLRVYDVSGREVAKVVDNTLQGGTHVVPWDASQAAPGVYLLRLQAGADAQVRRVTVVHR